MCVGCVVVVSPGVGCAVHLKLVCLPLSQGVDVDINGHRGPRRTWDIVAEVRQVQRNSRGRVSGGTGTGRRHAEQSAEQGQRRVGSGRDT